MGADGAAPVADDPGVAASATHVLALSRLFWWDADAATRREAYGRLACVVALMVCRSRAALWASRARSRQLDGLMAAAHGGSEGRRRLLPVLLGYLLASAAQAPLGKLNLRMRRGLRHQWVTHLTRYFLGNFIEAQCLQLGSTQDMVDPEALPDQRISEDVDKFASLVTSISLDALQGAIHVYTFGCELLAISRELAGAALLGAASSTWLTLHLGRRLRWLYAEERRTAGAFTYALTRLRENAESIAFYGGQRDEIKDAEAKLDARQAAEWNRFGLRDFAEAFRDTYYSVLSALPALVLPAHQPPGPSGVPEREGHDHGHDHGHDLGHEQVHEQGHEQVLEHSHDPGHGHGGGHGHDRGRSVAGGASAVGLVSRASEAFEELLLHFSIFAYNLNDFSRLAAVARELHMYQRSAESLARSKAPEMPCVAMEELPADGEAGEWLRATDLTLRLPGGRTLVRCLSVSAPATGGLLVMGPSGVGKTTFLRAAAGLWRWGSGSVARRAGPGEVMFLPQQPYMALGTLRRQLLYPRAAGGDGAGGPAEDARLVAALERVGLGALARCGGGLDAERRWDEELSVGERQRVAFARVLVHSPRYLLLDEATSACDAAAEADMYGLVAETCAAWLSVGHRPSIVQFHSQRLELHPDLSIELRAL